MSYHCLVPEYHVDHHESDYGANTVQPEYHIIVQSLLIYSIAPDQLESKLMNRSSNASDRIPT